MCQVRQLSPQCWLMEKRLKVAHDKIRNVNRKVSDVYLEVGFKIYSIFPMLTKSSLAMLQADKHGH
jgi:AraC-like DNA-binding protein